ncbi:MAG: helicase associated domain-containing protein, partial [Oscillospiraceae bacterium]|nr:helicase associated domain-containing protein [Oscillospiraceae bacterium]
KNGTLTEMQISRLDEIGMLWDDKFTRSWEKGFEHAKAYFNKNGNLDVPTMFVCEDGFKLGIWVANHRDKGCTRITEERRKRLDSIGMIWEKTDPWEARFALAKKYFEEHGNLDIPAVFNADGMCISKWVNEQKHIYLGRRKGKRLTDEQIKRLESIGMRWADKKDIIWLSRYEMLKQYAEKNGSADVPADYVIDGFKLGMWRQRQGNLYKKGMLTSEQIGLLREIGMCLDSLTFDEIWDRNYIAAKKWYSENGNLNVPRDYITDDGIKLYSWLAAQKTRYINGKLTNSQIDQLRLIGFEFENRSSAAWKMAYKYAEEYYRVNSNLDIAATYKTDSGFDLGYWLCQQRKNKSKLSDEQIKALDSIGMIWVTQTERVWEKGFEHLVQYKNKFGNVKPAVTYKSEDRYMLGRWVSVQKKRYADGKLNEKQIAKLSEIGVELN